MALTLATTTGWECQGCDHLMADMPEYPLYECSRCGAHKVTDERPVRCDDCNVFMARSDDHGCPECEEDAMVEVEGITCPGCDEFITVAKLQEAGLVEATP